MRPKPSVRPARVLTAHRERFRSALGFAWQPYGDGKTVIHGYGGLFYMPMQPSPNTLADNMPRTQASPDIFDALLHNPVSISYPTPNPPLLPGTRNVFIFPTNPRDPFRPTGCSASSSNCSQHGAGHRLHRQQGAAYAGGVAFQGINLNPQPSPTDQPGRSPRAAFLIRTRTTTPTAFSPTTTRCRCNCAGMRKT